MTLNTQPEKIPTFLALEELYRRVRELEASVDQVKANLGLPYGAGETRASFVSPAVQPNCAVFHSAGKCPSCNF